MSDFGVEIGSGGEYINYISVSANRKCFGSACFSTGGDGGGVMSFKPIGTTPTEDTEHIKLNGGKVDFPSLEPTTETEQELENIKIHFETRLNSLIANHNSLVQQINNASNWCEMACSQSDRPSLCYNSCMQEEAPISAYNQNLADLADWNADFKEYVAGLAYDMLGNCIPCEQIRDFLIARFGDVLKDGFLESCEEEKEARKIDTTCCILVCCDPCNYRLI